MSEIFVSQINIYPVKSLKGISVNSAKVESRGFQFDRRWMLVDQEGKFITQRQYPVLALVYVSISDHGLLISTEGKEQILIPFEIKNREIISVQIWKNTCEAVLVDKNVDEWFSTFVGFDCKLVYMPEETMRPVSPDYDKDSNIVGFADGFPFLVIGENSLNDLNSKLESPVLMNRFRPNIVVSGAEPFAEDTWKEIKIGPITFNILKPCERCVLTTIDQATGKSSGEEPLRTLATYRKINNKVIFGQNMTTKETGIISIGDKITIIK